MNTEEMEPQNAPLNQKPALHLVKYDVYMPGVAVACTIIGWLAIVAGGLTFGLAMADSGYGKPDQTAGLVSGLVVLFSSVFWLALARLIHLLAQIAENTRRA